MQKKINRLFRFGDRIMKKTQMSTPIHVNPELSRIKLIIWAPEITIIILKNHGDPSITLCLSFNDANLNMNKLESSTVISAFFENFQTTVSVLSIASLLSGRIVSSFPTSQDFPSSISFVSWSFSVSIIFFSSSINFKAFHIPSSSSSIVTKLHKLMPLITKTT